LFILLALLLVLARFANDAGRCWPSIPTLAKLCHVTERAIQRATASEPNGRSVTPD